jgi:hypothetical protein
MSRLYGLHLEAIHDPIRWALSEYSGRADGKVSFDVDVATDMEWTPEKPNSARSSSTVKHLGEEAATLTIIAFDHEDATGGGTYKMTDRMHVGTYPRDDKVTPRSKGALHSEAHLTIASFFGGHHGEGPVMFAGNMDLVGFKDETQTKIGLLAFLGQDPYNFTQATFSETDALPTVTLTTGYNEAGERFGDPHAVFNATPLIQVCGFIGITNEMAEEHSSMLDHLGAVEPKFIETR